MRTSTQSHYKFTEDEVKVAYQTSVVDVAQSLGIELKDEGKAYRIPGNSGLFLFKHGTGFYHGSAGEKGTGIDFLIKYCGVGSKQEAIDLVLHSSAIYIPRSERPKEEKEKGELILPRKAADYKRVYWYLLTKRGIDQQVVSKLMSEKKIYQEAERGNCVFVGYDKDKVARYATKRGTGDVQFRGDVENSDKKFAFHINGKPESNTVFVCESPIDAMSHASLMKLYNKDWQKDHTIGTGGLSEKALEQFTKDNPQIKRIVFCFDNDYMSINEKTGEFENHGQISAKKMYDTYSAKGFACLIHKPHLKDFNEDLCEIRKDPFVNLDALRAQRLEEFIKNLNQQENIEGVDELENTAEL